MKRTTGNQITLGMMASLSLPRHWPWGFNSPIYACIDACMPFLVSTCVSVSVSLAVLGLCREWRDFLLRKQPTGASLSCVFGRGMLRSLLLCCCAPLLRDFKGGPLGFCCGAIFHRLCDEAMLSPAARHAALQSITSHDATLEVRLHAQSRMRNSPASIGMIEQGRAHLVLV